MIPVTKITSILEETAKITGYNKNTVASIISHCFNEVRQQLEYPTYAGIRIPYLGVMRTTTNILNYYLRANAIPYTREGKITKERFQHLWKLRKLTREDEQRRDHTTRYGLEYIPDWRSSTDSTESDTGSHED